jgi:hypothetical protein
VTAPYCEVTARDPIPSRHPLAHRSGVHALANMMAADRHWRPLTDRGRAALATAYRAALDGAQPGDRIPLPTLPDDTHPATVRALERRGLVADSALTGLGVTVCAWALLGEKRPVHTLPGSGGRL